MFIVQQNDGFFVRCRTSKMNSNICLYDLLKEHHTLEYLINAQGRSVLKNKRTEQIGSANLINIQYLINTQDNFTFCSSIIQVCTLKLPLPMPLFPRFCAHAWILFAKE